MATAVLHAKQFVLALVEFVIADRSDFKPHHRQRFDRRLIVKHRRQKRAGTNQVSGCDKDGVGGLPAELLYECRHVFDSARRHLDRFCLVFGISDPDSAGRWPKVAVKIIDRKNPHLNRSSLRLDGGCRAWGACQHHG
jgi:hypothetical protein